MVFVEDECGEGSSLCFLLAGRVLPHLCKKEAHFFGRMICCDKSKLEKIRLSEERVV